MSVPKSRRLDRSISMSAVLAGPSIDIWRSCRFSGAMIRALGDLPGGLGRFLPCRIGANHCRLRSIGWERCLRLGPWRLLMLAFLTIYFFFLDTPLGLDSRLLMVLLGCGIVLQIFLARSLPGVTSFWWCCGLGLCCFSSSDGSWFTGFWGPSKF